MGTGLSRAPQPRGTDQEGRRRSQRARARGPHLRARRVPLDRQAGPAQPPPLVGALHPAQAGRAGRAHRQRRTRGARGRVLHAADPDRRRGDDRRAAAVDRVGERALRPRRRRRHRPSERAAALDPDRGHARDLGGPGRRGPHDAGSLRRHPTRDPGVPARGGHRRRGDRRHARRSVRWPSATWATPRSRTCPASTRPRSADAPPAARTPRSTTSPSAGSSARTASPATTCPSAAVCPPTRCSPSAWARSWNPTASPRCGGA